MRHGFQAGRGEGQCGRPGGGPAMKGGMGRRMAMAEGRGHGSRHFGPFGGDDFGGPDGGFSGGGRGGRGGGRRRLFDNIELRLLLLDLIRQEPRHGYELIREIETLSGGIYVPSPGMVYPALTLMTEMDQIAEQPSEGTRKRFAITAEGEKWLAEQAQERDAVFARLKGLAEHNAPRADHAPVRRAMDNLKAALRIRLQNEGADMDTILDVAALIDEAAAKVERLK
ncbi:MAG: PadR family transcriptional regulator [Sphingomonadales bacterium]|nr:MAG: PadR family transcriptional regulator [Sphingomonadales bacterium]TNF03880.1 MAG: PadR family transcriptional regulator [Sphingomonadales bacterium]